MVDTTVPGTGFAKGLLVDPSTGDIYVGGSADNATTSAFAVVAYQANGSPLASFGTAGQAITLSGTASAIRALAFDGSAIVASGTSGRAPPTARSCATWQTARRIRASTAACRPRSRWAANTPTPTPCSCSPITAS